MNKPKPSKTNPERPPALAGAPGSAFGMRVKSEIERARGKHKPINSSHEGYAVILEELEEFWEEVRKKSELRDTLAMYNELVQIAAMAQRTAEDVLEKQNDKAQAPARKT